MSEIETAMLDQQRTGGLIANLAALAVSAAAAQYSYTDIETRLELLEAYWTTFDQQDFVLQRAAAQRGELPYFKKNKYNEGLACYLQAKSSFKERLRALSPAQPPATVLQTGAGSSGQPSLAASLEKVRLPRFDGRRRDWAAFKEKFTSLVVNDNSIAPIIKLQHLTNCLEGEAIEKLRGIQQSADNFTTAWDTICRRYDNKFLRFKSQMQLLASTPPATHETESSISQILNVVNESINVFRSLGRPVDKRDNLLNYFVESKLPPETRRDWAKEVERKDLAEFPNFAELRAFLEGRLDTLDVVEMEREADRQCSEASSRITVEKSSNKGKKPFFFKKGKSSTYVASNGKGQGKAEVKCSYCQGDHFLSYCPDFVRCSQEERKRHVSSAGLCVNCLKTGHRQSACTSKNRCFVCGEAHHTKLHGVTNLTDAPPQGNTKSKTSTSAHAALKAAPRPSTAATGRILLSTARVLLQGPSGQCMTVRALLDSGAEESFISEYVAQALCLKGQAVKIVVSGVGGNPAAVCNNRVTVNLKSDYQSDFCLRFSALILRRLTAALPSETVTLPPWPELKGLQLADPGLGSPSRIDCILSSEAYAAALQPGTIRGPSGSLVAMQSVFGWVVMGATGNSAARDSGTAAFHLAVDRPLSEAVCRFWEIEEVPRKHLLTADEQECLTHFKGTYARDAEGRFVVRLPFKRAPVFSDTKRIAEKYLVSLERRLQRDAKLAEAYTSFMEEYAKLQHLEDVPEDEIGRHSVYYMPHHPVLKSDGSEKIRVVFNASQDDSEGNSLNTFLHVGPKLQEDVLIIIVRWAFLRVVFSCDIVKMFRQYRVHPEDRDWLRILLRCALTGLLRVCRMTTVTYGTGCAPFIANACLLELAELERERLPKACEVVEKDRYVDDFFSGADTLSEAIVLRDQLIELLASAGLQLDKWASNRPELLPNAAKPLPVGVPLEEAHTVSALGLWWNAQDDAFCFKIRELSNEEPVTKRVILSAIARLFDPIGWLSPFVIRPKILLQDLWMRGVGWDNPVPPDLRQSWLEFRDQIRQIEDIRIQRWFGTGATSPWTLHAFCDASERAYAAALYIVVNTEEGLVSHLMTAKSKVAPLKTISLPRLELCGAGVLAALVSYLVPKMPRPPAQVNCWTDSTVALAWITSHPSRWKTFVANRVSEIHEKLPIASWRHVRSADNPADLATRGLTPVQLRDAEIWWKGPQWLRRSESEWSTRAS